MVRLNGLVGMLLSGEGWDAINLDTCNVSEAQKAELAKSGVVVSRVRPIAAVGEDMALLRCKASNQPFAASANEYVAHSAAYFLLMFFAALTVSVTCRRY